MTVHIVKWEPTKKAKNNGAVALVLAIDAPNKKAAEGIAIGKLWEAYPAAADNFLKPEITEDQVGSPRPAVGVFDEQFAIDNEFDGERWKPRAAENEFTGPVDLLKQPADVKIAAVALYGLNDIDQHMLSSVVDLLNDEDSPDETGMLAVIKALKASPAVCAMYPRAVHDLIEAIFTRYNDEAPTELNASQFARNWVNNPDKRGEMVKPSGERESKRTPLPEQAVDHRDSFAKLSIDVRAAAVILHGPEVIDRTITSKEMAAIVNASVKAADDDHYMFDMIYALRLPELSSMGVQDYANFVANAVNHFPRDSKESTFANIRPFALKLLDADAPVAPIARAFKQTYETLDLEIACALFPSDFDIYNIPSPVYRRAKEIVAEKREDWARWSMALRITPNIKSYDRATIFGVVRNAPSEDTYHFPDSLQRHIDQYIRGHGVLESGQHKVPLEQPEVHNLGGLSEEPEVAAPAPISDSVTKQAKETLDKLGYGVYASESEQKSEQLRSDDFQQRAAQVEQTIAEQPKETQANLDIWKRVMRTDPRYTKPIEGSGFIGTSINSEYMFMRATEVFGPIGTGWGYTIIEEKMFTGAPMSEAVFENGKIIGNRILRDADGSILYEQNHSLQIEFWYVLNGNKGHVNAYGATPYMYKTKRGFMADGEVMKKSLTDAIKKSLSMLGFSADVFLGWHDLPEYREENATEFAIRNASDKAEDVTRLREELDEKLAKVAETISSAVTVNEANKVHVSIAREVETHRKAAEAKGDNEHAKYLAGRLRRLTALKDERIVALSKSEENA